MKGKTGNMIADKGKLCPDRQRDGLADELNERLEIGGNIRRRKLVRPFHVVRGNEFGLSFKASKEIEKKERDGIIAMGAADGISNSGNGADEGEINRRIN
jgi:hypothetical protein